MGLLWRVPYGAATPQEVTLPCEGTASIGWGDEERDGILFGLTSWTRSPAFFAYDPETARATQTSLIPPGPVDFSAVESTTVRMKSCDGTQPRIAPSYKPAR